MTFKTFLATAAISLTLPLAAIAAEDDVVNGVVSALSSAIEAGDIDAAKGFYAPEAAVMFDPVVPSRGLDTIGAAFTEFAAVSPVFRYPNGEQVIVVGDIALHIAPWAITGTTPDGAALADEGLSVAVLQRNVDGQWRIVIDQPYGDALLK